MPNLLLWSTCYGSFLDLSTCKSRIARAGSFGVCPTLILNLVFEPAQPIHSLPIGIELDALTSLFIFLLWFWSKNGKWQLFLRWVVFITLSRYWDEFWCSKVWCLRLETGLLPGKICFEGSNGIVVSDEYVYFWCLTGSWWQCTRWNFSWRRERVYCNCPWFGFCFSLPAYCATANRGICSLVPVLSLAVHWNRKHLISWEHLGWDLGLKMPIIHYFSNFFSLSALNL